MWKLALTPLLCLVPLKPSEKPKPKDAVAAPIQGVWVIESYELDGTRYPLSVDGAELRLTIEADALKASANNVESDYTLGADQKPRTIDVTPREGKHKGQTTRGVYEIDGDTLRLCCPLDPSAERPRRLTSRNGCGVLTLKRAKD
jgi:uncharacterized protein (TIGR03067 family)